MRTSGTSSPLPDLDASHPILRPTLPILRLCANLTAYYSFNHRLREARKPEPGRCVLRGCHPHPELPLPTPATVTRTPTPVPRTAPLPVRAPPGRPRSLPLAASHVAGARSSAEESSPSAVDVWQEMMPASTSCEVPFRALYALPESYPTPLALSFSFLSSRPPLQRTSLRTYSSLPGLENRSEHLFC